MLNLLLLFHKIFFIYTYFFGVNLRLIPNFYFILLMISPITYELSIIFNKYEGFSRKFNANFPIYLEENIASFIVL